MKRTAALAGLALLAACTPTPPPPPPAPPPAPQPIAGTYQGYNTLVSAGGPAEMLCGTGGPLTITLAGGSFTYTMIEGDTLTSPRTRQLTVPVGPDGRFNLTQANTTITGVAGNGHLTGDAFSARCSYHFELARMGE